MNSIRFECLIEGEHKGSAEECKPLIIESTIC